MNFFRRLIAVTLLVIYPCQAMLAVSNMENNTINAQNSQAVTTSSSDPLATLSAVGLSNPNYNWGPLSVGGAYDTLLGTIFNAHYAQQLTPDWAMGLIGEYGANQTRLNGTIGRTLWSDGQVKFTGEYLTQVLPFEFDSGDINQRVSQAAYGLQLQQNIHNSAFQNVNAGGYWSKAPNVGLSDVIFADNGLYYNNQRNIAGATTQGLDVGTDIYLTPITGLNAKVFYDNVHYNTEFTDDSSENTFGAGGLLALDQIVNDRMMFSVKSEFRAIYNVYGGSFSWAPVFTAPLGLHFAVFGERIISHNQTPDSNNFGLNIGFLSDVPESPHYALANNNDLEALESWVKSPAVYMKRVLAIAEQKTTAISPMIASIEPNTGPLVGGNTVLIQGTNFFPGVTVAFNGVLGVVTLLSSNQLSVVVPALALGSRATLGSEPTINEVVDVVVTNTNGQQTVFTQGYTYTNAFEPDVTDVSPNYGLATGGTLVTLTGTQLTGTTSVKFGNVAGTDITVVDDSTVTVNSPAHDAGTVTITLSTPGGINEVVDGYTYYSVPTVTGVSPSMGEQSGGDSVIITGSNFTDVTTVMFDVTPANSFTIDSPNQITAVTPFHAGGIVNVTVANPAGTSATSSADEYGFYGMPTITSIAPSVGSDAGGTSVTISGFNFSQTTHVYFGTTEATDFIVDSPGTITVTSPPGTGTVDIRIENPLHMSDITIADEFTYQP